MRIISGGQTGVDRAALDAAYRAQINSAETNCGFCPKGRRSEDGRIPDHYVMTESDSGDYLVRTELNVQLGDATLIIKKGKITPGTGQTIQLAMRHGKQCRIVDISDPLCEDQIPELAKWMLSFYNKILNVAGPRESKNPGIQAEATKFLEKLFIEYQDMNAAD